MNLEDYRKQIDDIDNEIVKLFVRRMHIAADIAQYKKENSIEILQSNREDEVLKKVCAKSPEELSPYTRTLFSTIMNLSKKYQEEKLNIK